MSTHDTRLEELATRFWNQRLLCNPLLATSLGFRQYDSKLPDLSAESMEAQIDLWDGFQSEAEAIAPDSLSESQAVTRQEMLATLARTQDRLATQQSTYMVSSMDGPHLKVMRLPQIQSLQTLAEGEDYIQRLSHMKSYFEEHLKNLKIGMKHGKVTAQKPLERVVHQITHQLERPTEEWMLVKHAAGFSKDLADRSISTINQGARPALANLLAFFLGELLPKARSNDKAGLCFLPGGDEDYIRCIHYQTSLKTSAQQVHDQGLEEVARLHRIILPLAQKTLGSKSIAELRSALENSPELHFKDEADILYKARAAVERATQLLPKITSLPLEAECRVLPVPALEAPHAPLGYYREPSTDGTRPGTYYVNTHAPQSKLSIDAEGVAFHEAVPGHHLQIAVAQSLDLPSFRRFETLSAYAEGWALYTEKLSDELGLYTRDLDRLGMYGQDLWRAARLVLDTGLHALGWSRQTAIDFGVRETLLPLPMIENEVDRYLVMPGQALGYKLGEFEFLKLRKQWEAAPGSFHLPDFHDAVLKRGGLSLDTLSDLAQPPQNES